MTKYAEFKTALQVFLELIKSEELLFANDLDDTRDAVSNVTETFKKYSWSAETQDVVFETYEIEAELVLRINGLEEADRWEESDIVKELSGDIEEALDVC